MKGKSNNMIYILFVIYVILSATGLVLFKSGTTGPSFIHVLNISITLKMIVGIMCYGMSFLLWLYIVSKLNLTFAMPLSVALVNTLVVIESVFVLKEKISLYQGIGIFVVLVGVVLITGGSNG